MKILVDAMSGDFAPVETIKGASLAAKEYADHEIVIVGDENIISDIAIKNEIDISRLSIIHTPGIITMEDSPTPS